MKNKFILTEEESKRILSLHKNKIQEERSNINESETEIDEQYSDPGQTTGRVAAGAGSAAATGAGIGAIAAGLATGGLGAPAGAAIGAVIGTGVGALAGWLSSGGGYYDRVKKAIGFCRKHKNELGRPINSMDRLRDIADTMRASIQGPGTDEVLIQNNIRKLKTMPDFCKLNEIYNIRFNESLVDALDGDIDMDDDWRDFVWIPLSELAQNTKKITTPVVSGKCSKIINWFASKGYTKITADRYRQLANDKTRQRAYKFCPEINGNLYFAKPVGGGENTGGGGGGGSLGGGDRYGFNYQEALTAIKSKCPGGGGTTGQEEKYADDWSSIQDTETKVDTTVSQDNIQSWGS